MAIDTKEKRASVAGIALPFQMGLTPNATHDAEWRAEAGNAYPYSYGAPSGVGALFMEHPDLTGLAVGGPFFANPIG